MERGRPEDPAELAFESLRAEVTVMRRAVESLADQLQTAAHGQKLEAIGQGVDETLDRLEEIVDAGAVTDPATFQRSMAQARAAAFRPAQDALHDAGRALATSAHRFDAAASRLRLDFEQKVLLRRVAAVAALVGFVAFPFVAFPLARAMPVSWQWPEKLAALADRTEPDIPSLPTGSSN